VIFLPASQNILSYPRLQVIHQHRKIGGVVAQTGSDSGAHKDHRAAITGPATRMSVSIQQNPKTQIRKQIH